MVQKDSTTYPVLALLRNVLKSNSKKEAVYHAQFVCYPDPDNNLLNDKETMEITSVLEFMQWHEDNDAEMFRGQTDIAIGRYCHQLFGILIILLMAMMRYYILKST